MNSVDQRNTGKKRRPAIRQLPFKHSLYQRLQEQEARIDHFLIRKRLDLQEALGKTIKQKRTLRIFFSNTYSSADEAWSLRIEGRLLGHSMDARVTPKKFTHFLRQVVVELENQTSDPKIELQMDVDGNVDTENDTKEAPSGSLETIVWKKIEGSEDVDGFEIKRKGSRNVACKIYFSMDYLPEKFKLSAELRELLDIYMEIKPNIILALWQYIKSNRLQDPHDHRTIVCDDGLKKVFGVESFTFTQLSSLLHPHLLTPDPFVFEYVVRTDQEKTIGSQAFDLVVDVEDPTKIQMLSFLSNSKFQKEVSSLDLQVIKMVEKIHQHSLKRDFMMSFAENPVDFINNWVEAQSRDLELIHGDTQINKELQRRSKFYEEDWVAEAVYHYLAGVTQLTPVTKK